MGRVAFQTKGLWAVELSRTVYRNWTATDTLEFQLTFNRPIDLTSDYVVFGGEFYPPPQGYSYWEGFNVTCNYGCGSLNFSHTPARRASCPFCDPPRAGDPFVEYDRGPMAYTIDRNMLTASIAFSEVGLSGPIITINAQVADADTRELFVFNGGDWGAVSAIDERIAYTPEPSSVALASLGVGLLGFHLARRNSFARRA